MRRKMRARAVLKVITVASLLSIIGVVIINDGSFRSTVKTFDDNDGKFFRSFPERVNVTLPTTNMPSVSEFVHSFPSIEDEILYIYQKYLLVNWKPRLDRVQNMRVEIFRSSNSTQVDQLTLSLNNTNAKSQLPFYAPNKSPNHYKPPPALLKNLPNNSIFSRGTVFGKCSVVGNAGLILHSMCGREIDSADYVFRCNMVPIKKFGVDAGLKTNFTTMNPSIVKVRYNNFHNGTDVENVNKDLEEYTGHLFLPCLHRGATLKTCTNKILSAIRQTQGRLEVSVGNSKHLLGILNNWKAFGIRYMSTGFYLTQTAITLCNEVHLYGFWPFSKSVHPVPKSIQYHFFDDMKKSKAHSFNKEFQMLWQLHMHGIIRIHVHECQYLD